MADLLVLPRPAESLQDGADFSGKTYILGLPKRKRWPQCYKESTPEPPLPRGKQNHLSRLPDREVKESQGEREPQVSEKEGDRSGSVRRKGWTSQ